VVKKEIRSKSWLRKKIEGFIPQEVEEFIF